MFAKMNCDCKTWWGFDRERTIRVHNYKNITLEFYGVEEIWNEASHDIKQNTLWNNADGLRLHFDLSVSTSSLSSRPTLSRKDLTGQTSHVIKAKKTTWSIKQITASVMSESTELLMLLRYWRIIIIIISADIDDVFDVLWGSLMWQFVLQ